MDKELIRSMFNDCSVARLLGIEVLEVEEGRAMGRLTLKKEHMNVFHTVHGGILFAFADHIGGACGNTVGKKVLLVESTVQFVKPVAEGETLYAESVVTHRGRKIGRGETKVFNEGGEAVAFLHMLFFNTDDDKTTGTP